MEMTKESALNANLDAVADAIRSKKRGSGPILATPANMKKYGGPGVFAYDRYSQDRFSATAGDYFMRDDDKPLTGTFGRPLILAREVCSIVAVQA